MSILSLYLSFLPGMNFFGLDIGSSSLKLVELRGDRNKTRSLQLFAASQLSRTVDIPTASDEDLKDLATVVKEFVDSYLLLSKKVVVALPESQIFTRVVNFPKMTEKELSGAIPFEAQQYVPIPLSEVSLDYQIIESLSSTDNQMEVLIIAAPKTLVVKYLKVLKDASLEVIGLETETIAVARSLISDPRIPTTLIVNIGALTTDLSVVSAQAVRFTRSIATGGTALARAISQTLGFDLAQSEEYKKTYGFDATQLEGKVMQAIKPIFDVVVDEIKRSTAYYNTRHKDDNVKRIVICGGTASIPGTVVYLASSLDLEVELGNPWSRIGVPSKFSKKELEENGPSFAVAVGLALKEI